MTAIKVTQVLTNDRLRIKIVSVVATPYVDCDNKNESLESLFKRCVVLQADGTYVLQVHYI
jgi:RecB family endonuclease NucS